MVDQKAIKLVMRLSPRLSAQLREVCDAEDRTYSEYVRELLRRELILRGSA